VEGLVPREPGRVYRRVPRCRRQSESPNLNRPVGTGYFSHDSRHFVPGYYRAVPPGLKPFAHRSASHYLSAYGVSTPGTCQTAPRPEGAEDIDWPKNVYKICNHRPSQRAYRRTNIVSVEERNHRLPAFVNITLIAHLSAWGILDLSTSLPPSQTGCPSNGKRWRLYPLSPIGREGLPAASISVYHRRHRRVGSNMRWQIGL
jgi:hypothetical protein